MNIEKMNIIEIIPYENNAKIHTKEQIEQIKKSIIDFGNNDPIAIDQNNIIIEGHGRYLALKELGYEEIEVIKLLHLTEEQRKAYTLIHNKLTMNTDFDIEILEKELESIQDIDMEYFDFDFDMEEIEPEEIVEDEIPEPPEEPKSKLGDIYQLGNHRLMCGDSTSLEDVSKLLNENKMDMVITDPPYNVNYEGGTKDKLKIENDNMSNEKFYEFLYNCFKNLNYSLKAGGTFYIWFASREHINFEKALNDNELLVRQELIWCKNALVMGRQDYQWKHEPCLYGWKEGDSHHWYSDRSQTTILEFNKPTKNNLHPTMKPIELFAYLIKNSSKKNDNVIDLFGGSGTTIMACEQLNRTCYMMEYDPKYIDVIINRWETLTGEKAILLNE